MANHRRFRLDTARLRIRVLDRGDLTEFTRYRNIGAIARYQDWPLPYTRDLAHQLLDELELLTGPTGGGWVQLALDDGSGIIGDLAVWLDADLTLATIGYTLAPQHHGKGYAAEAVGAIVDWLFTRKRVHRITATIDPRNLASARVLERCGFEHVGTARSAALVRGEWTDDSRFSLLEPDRRAWVERPTGPPREVTLVEITSDNVLAVGDIDGSFSQQDLVAPVLVSLAQAFRPRTVRGDTIRPWLRAIEADGDLVGFVMMAEPYDGQPFPYLWRFLIEHRHQGRGIGRRAILEIARHRRREGCTHLRVNFVPDVPGSPAGFYESLGFERTGVVEHGEVEALLDLRILPD
jgi:RimJ/RimL family protein N-acetyltransferase